MENGVPVLVAQGKLPPEQVVSNGQVVLNSGTLTLPPVSLSDVMSLSPSSETDPELGTRGTEGFDSRFYRTHTYFTTFTFLNHFKEGDRSVVLTSRETVSNVLTLPAAVTTPSSTRFQTETYLSTYTYFRTTTRGNREHVTSTQEVVTQIVVTEAPAAPPLVAPTSRSLLYTKTYLSTVTLFDTAVVSGTQVLVSTTSVIRDVAVETSYIAAVRPTATRPVIQATVAPAPRPVARPPPVVDPSLLPVGEQDEIHVVATKTFYTTSTFYTTLLEGSSTVVRTRTEVTSRLQTEKVTTRLDSWHLSSLRSSFVGPAATSTTASSLLTPLVTANSVAAPVESQPTPSRSGTPPQPSLVAASPVPAPPLGGEDSDQTSTTQEEPSQSVETTPSPATPTTPSETPSPPESAAQSVTASSEPAGDAATTAAAEPQPAAADTPTGAASLVSTTTSVSPATPSTTTAAPSGGLDSSESTAASLGNLAGSLLGLSGLGAAGLGGLSSMVDTAAGLFRNVLPVAVRRDGSSGVPPDSRPPPAVHVQQRNPAFIPVGGVAASLRNQQLATAAPGGGFLAVMGPEGEMIRLRGAPNGRPPAYVEAEFADQQTVDDQDYAASVQGPFGTGQLTYFDSADAGFVPDQGLRPPLASPSAETAQDAENALTGQVFWSQRPVSTSTLHTIASLEGDNRIVGTNVFANVPTEEAPPSESPSIPVVDLELEPSTERVRVAQRGDLTSGSISGDDENDKINFIVSSSFDVRVGSATSILGPDVRTLRPDTRVTSQHSSSATVIHGESTVFGGLFTRPPLPVENVHDITEIVTSRETEQFTRTVTATKTDIRFEGSSVVTSTKVITSTLPPITIVSTVIGTSTQVHTLNTATPTRVQLLSTATRLPAPAAPRAPPPEPPREPPREREREREQIAIAGVYVPDSIELGDIRKGVDDDNEVNRVVISPGVGQQIVVEQSEAVATRCERPCLPAIFETCRRVGGAYRCACRPGYSRAREQDPCEPTLTYRLHVLLDRVNDIPLSFRPPFADRDSSEFGQMARLTEAGLGEALAATPLADRLHTTQLMGFKPTRAAGEHGRPRLDGLMAEIMVQVSDREKQSLDKAVLQDTVQEALRSTNYSLGGQQVVVSRHTDAITALDFDECQEADYNDCHAYAFCYNLVGTFTCSCKDGMVDMNVNESPGRACSAESAGCKECSYSGECYTRDDGATGCRCHRWYAGNRCQINLRVLLIALVTVGAVLALMLCACCFLCCRRKGRSHVAPPLVFTGPAGFLRHRGTSLHNPVIERRAMLDSSSDTSAASPPRRVPAPAGTRRAPAPAPPPSMGGRSRRSGRTNPSFQEDRSMASTGVRPAVFIPRAKHKHPRPASAGSSAVRVGADGSADLRSTQSRLLSVLEPGPRGRPRAGTFTSQRTARSVSSGRRGRREEVSHHPTGRSRSSDNLSQRGADSLADPADYGSHNFFRERTMSEARSFDETTIRPSVRSMRGFGTQCSRLSSRALSSNMFTYDHHTMAERDAASTFVMPETQLFRPAADSDAQSEFSLADDFPQIHASGRGSRPPSATGSRRGLR
ncbi:uncharacterized protein LOC119102687 [Pollicipes pollicipes]|uniref:uncharacterized protein LOC119102687 n=1 Tax=Pollicipes pollicipes TaxID=41117 RepID=UPI0018857C3E|nr:uncharacterized protein LOC119102687 [Pollicipes pollicipes]